MRINPHYVAPVLAAGAALFIAGATASAVTGPQPAARVTDAPLASPDQGGAYCGQFCGSYSAYGDLRGGAAAPTLGPVGAPWLDPLHATSPGLPIVAVAAPIRQH
jgi:hypothetical protein